MAEECEVRDRYVSRKLSQKDDVGLKRESCHGKEKERWIPEMFRTWWQIRYGSE